MRYVKISTMLIVSFIMVLSLVTTTRAAVFNVTNPAELQSALTAAQANGEDDTINVAPGTYNISTILFFNSVEAFSLSIQGAGAGSTILDGGNSNEMLLINSTSIDSHIAVRGITFQNAANNTSNAAFSNFSNGDVTIENCAFTGNSGNTAGALFVSQSMGLNPTFTLNNNTFTGNTNGTAGAAEIDILRGSATISDNTFTNNSGTNGGGLNLFIEPLVPLQPNPPSVNVTGNVFSGNSATGHGGGLDITGGDPSTTLVVTNNTFAKNSASLWGGGLYFDYQETGIISITNNSLSGNSASKGSSIYLSLRNDNLTANIYNNIAWDLNENFTNQIFVDDDGDTNGTASFVNLFNNDYESFGIIAGTNLSPSTLPGTNIINQDPLFVDVTGINPSLWDVHIRATSPAENSGLNSAPGIPSIDFDGEARIMDTTVDMGADEITLVAPEITVTDSVAPANDLTVPFGDVTENTTSDQTVTVTNDGTADLIMGTVSGPAAPFSIQADTCSGQTVTPAGTCSITVRFAPTATGAFNDTFDIPSNDADENPVTVSVSGTGTSASSTGGGGSSGGGCSVAASGDPAPSGVAIFWLLLASGLFLCGSRGRFSRKK